MPESTEKQLHLSNFTQDPVQVVLDLVNHDNMQSLMGYELSVSNVTVGTPEAIADGERNTKVTITATPGQEFRGTREVTYNRLDIQEVADVVVPDGVKVQAGGTNQLSEIVGYINNLLFINLQPGDYTDVTLEDWEDLSGDEQVVTLSMNEEHLLFTGDLSVTVRADNPTLTGVIANTELDGLNLPGPSVMNLEVWPEPGPVQVHEFDNFRVDIIADGIGIDRAVLKLLVANPINDFPEELDLTLHSGNDPYGGQQATFDEHGISVYGGNGRWVLEFSETATATLDGSGDITLRIAIQDDEDNVLWGDVEGNDPESIFEYQVTRVS